LTKRGWATYWLIFSKTHLVTLARGHLGREEKSLKNLKKLVHKAVVTHSKLYCDVGLPTYLGKKSFRKLLIIGVKAHGVVDRAPVGHLGDPGSNLSQANFFLQ
jgi:hypothetical protein